MSQRRMIWVVSLSDLDLGRCSDAERLLFYGLILLADDDGRGLADADYLRAEIWRYHPRRNRTWVESTLQRLAARMRSLNLYEVAGRRYYALLKWERYQRLRKDIRKPSQIPPPLQVRHEPVTEPLQGRNESAPQGSQGLDQTKKGLGLDQSKEGEVEGKPSQEKSAGSASALVGAKASPASQEQPRLVKIVSNKTLVALYHKCGFEGMKVELRNLNCPASDAERLQEADVQSLAVGSE